jgi:hypothetical protein
VYYKNNRKGRLSPREQAEAINRAHEFAAAAMPADKAKEYRERFVTVIPPKRTYIRRPVDKKPVYQLEKEVLADALQALRNDPRVWIVDRNQSGVFQDGDRFIRIGSKGQLDIKGMLHGGAYFEIEAKRPGEKPDENQLRRIEHVRKGGGISGWFTSAAEALALLP